MICNRKGSRKMVTIKSKKEIELMREACRVTALVHKALKDSIKHVPAH